MESFFRNNDEKQPELEGKESAVTPAGVVSNETDTDDMEQSSQEVSTALSFHPAWEVSEEDRAVFEKLNEQCGPLGANQLGLSGITIRKNEANGLDVVAFIRNGLDRPVMLKETTLMLLDTDGITLARKVFNLKELGEIPAHSSRPWKFSFTNKDVLSSDVPESGWKLGFQFSKPTTQHRLELADTWKKVLSKDTQKQLKEAVDKLGPPQKGQVNFLSFQARQNPMNGDLHVTLLIQNGTDNAMEMTQLPLQVEDASREVVAKANFKLDKLTINPNTSKPWTFIFPKKMITKEKLDLSRWKAYAPPKQ